jgi:hypothetical protein
MRHSRSVVSLTASALLVAGLLAGCADRPGAQEPDEPGAPPAATGSATAPADPSALIGIWTLADAGADSGKILRLAAGDLRLWRSCGSLMGSWRADAAGLFIADVHGSSGCPLSADPTPDWLRRVTAFRADGDDRLLLDAQGQPVARLAPGGKPPQDPNLASSEAEPPKVTDEIRQAFAPAAPLPAGLAAADRQRLLGRWEPAQGRAGSPKPAYLEFTDDGAWRGSDGCNGQGGRWVAGDQGALLATSGPSTLIGCDNVPIAGWIADARRAGLDGQALVLVDAQGEELGRLRPAKR